ncbi:hypothetical protein [Streptomyces sp. NBC_00554]|uniref:hypothetical protein n=1 Tax=unclassified Streptomyces TaxID=2593676 RepID=UPI00352DD39E|nr:hypothetical protein OG256_01840 [Streptomyces sp. NBC_00564]WUC54872.1 hypothetical protein OG266_43630 [Streptomyces sp. NBC_00554]
MHVLLSPHAAADHGGHGRPASAAHSALTGSALLALSGLVHRHAAGASLAERVTLGLEIALLFAMADMLRVGRNR